jgi:multidrug efflux pump subunit AcrB
MLGDRLLDQRADHVRHGAGDRHPGRRRHRGGRERRAHHGEEGLPPREATRKAMGQITGAIVGITVVLVSVFVPMAFFGGSVGNIYRQFSLTMVASMLFSAFLALSLTPALCATLLKPVAPRPPRPGRLLRLVQPRLQAAPRRATRPGGAHAGAAPGRFWLLVYVALVIACGALCTCACPPPSCPTRTRAM